MARQVGRGWWSGWLRLAVLGAVLAPAAQGGGTPEEALLIIDPTRPDGMYVGNYYLSVRDVPRGNVLYMNPMAPNYTTFAADNIDALLGTIANLGIRDHCDYIVLPPASGYRVSAPGLVQDDCSPVNNFALSSVYTLALIKDRILAGTMTSTRTNRYYDRYNVPVAFDSEYFWVNGYPGEPGTGHQYFIGAYLGYTGERGNTVEEIITMIDRAVAVDGTHPAGTFYFMETTDEARSGPRDGYYPTAVGIIIGLGGQAEHLLAVLPEGRHDCLGIMTGWASPDIDGADMTILPGAFCDHLTSYAGTFDTASQVKMSRWIANGAGGSWGTVEEPCNYWGKFPHARMHIYYFMGLSLGEAVFRSVGFIPFQGLMYGDPLTRPFAYLPEVDVPDAPAGPVSGLVTLTPVATATAPGAQIARLDLLIDGVLHSSVGPGGAFAVDTSELSDGWHDVRVLAFDDTDQRFTGRWVGSLTSDNRGRAATLDVTPASGDWTTAFVAELSAAGGDVTELRLVHNGRVVAAAPGSAAQLSVYGLTLGAGPVRVQAEALFADNERVCSAPVELEIAYGGGTPGGQPPVAFSYSKFVRGDQPFVVELPATFDDVNTPLTYELLSQPAQCTVVSGTGPYRLMRPQPLTEGNDVFTFRVNSAAGTSNVGTVTLVYRSCIGDLNGDGQVDLADLATLLANYGRADEEVLPEHGDLDWDGDVDLSDLSVLLARYGSVCG